MKYIVKPRAARKIYTFYGNVAKKYRHTYDKADYKRNVSEALNSIFRIENGLLRREPTISQWAGYHMANTDKWYFAYTIDGDTITVVDAYNESVSHVSPATSMSTREKLKMNTMSVDEYFDELIDQVRHDYTAI